MRRLFDRYFREEKDLFILIFGLFLLAVFIIAPSLFPFRPDSLLIVFLFMAGTRLLINDLKYKSYAVICIGGLVLSIFLSPYALIIYFAVALYLYTKTRLI